MEKGSENKYIGGDLFMASEKDAGKQSAVKLVPLLITVAVGLIIWFIPAPSGLEPKAWHLFAIFVATIIALSPSPCQWVQLQFLHWRLLH